ncbi:hypothetical protein AB3N60_14325 [Leptospira sp. WS39.C2]
MRFRPPIKNMNLREKKILEKDLKRTFSGGMVNGAYWVAGG